MPEVDERTPLRYGDEQVTHVWVSNWDSYTQNTDPQGVTFEYYGVDSDGGGGLWIAFHEEGWSTEQCGTVAFNDIRVALLKADAWSIEGPSLYDVAYSDRDNALIMMLNNLHPGRHCIHEWNDDYQCAHCGISIMEL